MKKLLIILLPLFGIIITLSSCTKCYTCSGQVTCGKCIQYKTNGSTLQVNADCDDKPTYLTTKLNCSKWDTTDHSIYTQSWMSSVSSVDTREVCGDADLDIFLTRGYACYGK